MKNKLRWESYQSPISPLGLPTQFGYLNKIHVFTIQPCLHDLKTLELRCYLPISKSKLNKYNLQTFFNNLEEANFKAEKILQKQIDLTGLKYVIVITDDFSLNKNIEISRKL